MKRKKRARIYLDDPDDNRRRYTQRELYWLRIGSVIFVTLLLIIYLFLPPWLYLVVVPVAIATYYYRDRSGNSEADRLRGYLQRIPAASGLSRERLYQKLQLPEADLDRTAATFPELCGDDAERLTADQAYCLVVAWYYWHIKNCPLAQVREILANRPRMDSRR